MGDFLHRTTKQLLRSVSPNSLPEPIQNYIAQPDLSAVDGQPEKYWSINGDTVSLMNKAARDTADAAEAQVAINADRAERKASMDRDRFKRALIEVMRREINTLRAELSLSPLSSQHLVDAIKTEIDNV